MQGLPIPATRRTPERRLTSSLQHADAIAKHSAPWHTAPVGRWKANHHVPVWSSIRQVHPCKFWSKQAGQPARAPIQESIAAEDVQSQLLKQLVEDTLRQETWDGSMEQTAERLDAVLNDCVRTVYPPKSRPDDRLFTQPTYQLKLKNMWAVYADYKRARVATMGNILHKWKLLTTFHKASKLFREHAKLAKRTKITRVAGELAEASAKGDQRGIWQGAKKLAPWKPRTKMSIRGPEGTILSPEEQLQALLDYSTRKFCHGDPEISEHRMHADFTLTEQEVERLVSKTPLRKAVPESVAPSAVWKLCAASISQVIVHALRSSWGAAQPALIPQHWKDSQLVWIAKPNKDPSKPQGYRPIELSHPLAKSLNKLVRERLQPYLESKLRHLPQFAYTNGRGVLDALLRVHSHLRSARQLSLQGRASIYALHQGRRANPCVGGLSFSLDLEGAFDSVPRPKLAESLRRLGVPEDLIDLAMEFYSNARYHTHIGEHKGHVTTTCGIKQGCTLAPYLFVAHTLAILEDIQVRVGGDWVQTCMTFFADDALGCWHIHSLPELRKAFADIQVIIDVFNEQGMTLSNDKSVVLYDLQGRDAGRFLARRKVRKHQQQHFLFRQRGQNLWVPIKKSHEYLGTIIAYRDAQSKTVTHRLKKARGQYSQLRKTINSTRIVSNRPRYQVWRAGVLSAATYGLLSVGVTSTSKRSLQAMASRQMRAIARRPAHLTHLTNAQVRQALNAEEPLAALHAQGEKYLQRLHEVARLQPDDIRGQESSRLQLAYALSTLQVEPEPPAGGLPTEAPEASQFRCQHCHKKYDSLTSLKKHMAISHKVKFTQCVAFDPARHAIGNLPQCAFCHRKFDSWHALKQHIQRLNCPILMQQVGLSEAVPSGSSLEVRPSVAGRQPGHEDPDIQACIGEKGWQALLDSPHAQHFRQHCSLCNRWIKDPTALKRHLKQTHGNLWALVAPELEAKCAEVKHQLSRDGTCPWCERTSYSRHYHQCNVIFQSALLGLLHGRQRDGRLRELATGPSGSTRTTGDNGSEAAPREQLSGRTTKQEGQAHKTGRQGWRPGSPPTADWERGDHASVTMSAARGCIEPHQAGDIPHTAPSTKRPRRCAQGAVQRRHSVARQEEQRGASTGPSARSSLDCFWPKHRPGSNSSPKTKQQ